MDCLGHPAASNTFNLGAGRGRSITPMKNSNPLDFTATRPFLVRARRYGSPSDFALDMPRPKPSSRQGNVILSGSLRITMKRQILISWCAMVGAVPSFQVPILAQNQPSHLPGAIFVDAPRDAANTTRNEAVWIPSGAC
jgi:hypothetical protein